MNIKPARNYILLSIVIPTESRGGLHLPSNSQKDIPYGKVVAVGPLVSAFAPDDKVIFLPNAVIELPGEDGELLHLLEDGCILAKLE